MNIELGRYRQQDIIKFRPTGADGYPNGKDNMFAEYLDSLYNSSPTHACIINDLTSYIVGKGLIAKNPAEQERIDKFLPKKKQLEIVKYHLIQNSKAIEVIKDGANDLQELNVKKPSQIRVLELFKGKPTRFVYRQNFKRGTWGYKVYDHYEAFDPEEIQVKSLFYTYDNGTFEVPYGRPYYMSGLNATELEAGIFLMHNHGVMNGMLSSMIAEFEDTGDPELNQKVIDNMVLNAAGPGNAGKIIPVPRKPGSQPLNFQVPNTHGIDKVYENQYLTSESGITKAHGLPTQSIIAGLNIKATGFGNAEEEMQWGINQWKFKKFEPYREEFIEEFAPIFKEMGVTGGVSFEDRFNINEKIQEEKLSLSKEVLSDEDQDYILDYLQDKGSDESSLIDQGFELVEEVDLEGDDGLKIKAEQLTKLADLSPWGLTPNDLSKYDVKDPSGEGVWLVRYQYALASKYGSQPPIIDTSRRFCEEMIDAAKNGNRVYKRESLMKLSNPEFGGYNLFWYKGSYNCRHVWKRKLYYRPKGWKPRDGNKKVRPVGNVPYVASKLNDSRATSANRKVRR